MAGRAATTRVAAGDYALSIGINDMPAPQGWVWVPLPDVARLESGHTPSREHSEYWDGDVPWVGIPDAREHHGTMILETRQRITQAGLDNSAARRLPTGTVCLSRTASIGYVTVLGREMATSQDFVDWICSPALDPEFLKWLFVAEKAALLRFGTGSTHKTIYYPEVKAFRICMPQRATQARIVAKIDALNVRSHAAREALEQVPPLLERFRQSVLAAAFRGDLTTEWRRQHANVEPASVLLERIRVERRRRWEDAELAAMRTKGKEPATDAWKAKYKEPDAVDSSLLSELPKGWRWARWEQVGFCQNGHTYPSKFYADSGTRLLRPGNLHVSGRVVWTPSNTRCMPSEWEEDSPRHVVLGNELVMNLTAQSLKDEFLGRICLTDADERCLLNQRIGRLTPVTLEKRYLLWLFKSPRFRRYVDGLNSGSLIQHMFTSQLDQFALPVAPLEEQKQIIAEVERRLDIADEVCAQAVKARNRIARLDQSVLAAAFRGKLVRQDPSKEPASVLSDCTRAERETADAGGTRARRGRPTRLKGNESADGVHEPPGTHPAANGNGKALNTALGTLKREALLRVADAKGIELVDRRSVEAVRAGVVADGVTLDGVLEHLDRDELKAVCRALRLVDRGRTKEELRARVMASSRGAGG